MNQPIRSEENQLGSYPRIYRATRGTSFLVLILCVALALGGIAGVLYFGSGHEMKGNREALGFAILSLFFVILAALTFLAFRTTKVTLQRDAIEYCDLFSRRLLHRSEIAGTRTIEAKGYSTLLFEPNRTGLKKLTVPSFIGTDAEFDEWVGTFPNLDVRDLEASKKQLEEPAYPYETQADRAQLVARAKRVAVVVNVIATLVCVWGWLSPQPYQLVALALMALPFCVLFIGFQNKGTYNLDQHKNDARPSLTWGIIGPTVVLGLRAIWDFNFLSWKPFLLIGLMGGAVIAYLAFENQAGGKRARQSAIAFFFFGTFLCWATTAEADAAFDRSAGRTYSTKVIGQRISRGKTTTYYITVEPWGPVQRQNEISVHSGLYYLAKPGSVVCVQLHHGALGVQWFTVAECGQ